MTREAAVAIINAILAGVLSTEEIEDARREAFRHLDSHDEVARTQAALVVEEADAALADRREIARLNERSARATFAAQLDHHARTGRLI